MKTTIRATLLGALLAIPSISTAQGVVDDAERFMREYAKELMSGDREGIAKRYDPHGAWMVGNGEKRYMAWAAIRDRYTKQWSPPKAFAWKDLTYEPSGNGAVTVVGRFDWTGNAGPTITASYSALLVKQDGQLRIRVEDESWDARLMPMVSSTTPVYHPGESLTWVDAPPAMPPGLKMALLEGDPTKPGLFTMRIKFPAGSRIMPHTHSQVEHATVVQGTLHIGMGATFDSLATKPMKAGSFGYWPPGMQHYAWFEGEVILQLHGQGPWTITYVNPADDPRNKVKQD